MAERFFRCAILATRAPTSAPRFEQLHLVASGTLPRKITEERSQFDAEEAFPSNSVNLMALTLGTDHVLSLREIA